MPSLTDMSSTDVPTTSQIQGLSFRTRLLNLADEYEDLQLRNEELMVQLQASMQASIRGSQQSCESALDVPSEVLSSQILSEAGKSVVRISTEIEDIAPVVSQTSPSVGTNSHDQVGYFSGQAVSHHLSSYTVDKQCSREHSSSHGEEVEATIHFEPRSLAASGEKNMPSPRSSRHSYRSNATAVHTMLPGFMSPRRRLGTPDNILALLSNPPRIADTCVLVPGGIIRITFDVLILCGWLFELWAVPFEFIFCETSAIPIIVDTTSSVVLGLFFFDTLLNFNTGYFQKDLIIKSRKMIIYNYLKFWFWVDVLATIPWPFSGCELLRLIHSARMLRLYRTWSVSGTRYWISACLPHKSIATIAKVLFLALIFIHIHACIWALLQSAPEQNLDSAIRWYADSFYWAYAALTVGALTTIGETLVPSARPWKVYILELWVASERVAFMALLIIWGMCQAQAKYHEHSKFRRRKRDIMTYIKRHKVSIETQVELLFSLHENGQVMKSGKRFQDLSETSLPAELKQKVFCELWLQRLRSHALIEEVRKMDEDFLPKLVMLVKEDVFPTKAVIFSIGDASLVSYFVLEGSLASLTDTNLPEFTPGSWVGETALVNPLLKRRMTIMATEISALMCVPADGFHELLKRHNLRRQFELVCRQNLWKGLCGRCGALGDHNTDECPYSSIANSKVTRELMQHDHNDDNVFGSRESMRSSFSYGFFGARSADTNRSSTNLAAYNQPMLRPKKSVNRELQQYLAVNHLERLRPRMSVLGIHDLDDLSNTSTDEVNHKLQACGEAMLSMQELKALTSEAIEEFRLAASKAVQRLLFVPHNSHFIFLSHSKKEAGTEAALMQRELELIIAEDRSILGARHFDVPIFLDSENLNCLKDVQAAVNKTHNLVVLLTADVLTRPWVLVEIVTATRGGIKVMPVRVSKPDAEFVFPGQEFYDKLSNHDFLPSGGAQVLLEAGIDIAEVESCLRDMFQQIALPYSPHRSTDIREQELRAILKRCRVRAENAFDRAHAIGS